MTSNDPFGQKNMLRFPSIHGKKNYRKRVNTVQTAPQSKEFTDQPSRPRMQSQNYIRQASIEDNFKVRSKKEIPNGWEFQKTLMITERTQKGGPKIGAFSK